MQRGGRGAVQTWFEPSPCGGIRKFVGQKLGKLQVAYKRTAQKAVADAIGTAKAATKTNWKESLLNQQDVTWDEMKTKSAELVRVAAAKKVKDAFENLREDRQCWRVCLSLSGS